MGNFFETLLEVLMTDERFFAEDGTLLRNKVYESAIHMDSGLIRLLLSNAETKARFFTDVDGISSCSFTSSSADDRLETK